MKHFSDVDHLSPPVLVVQKGAGHDLTECLQQVLGCVDVRLSENRHFVMTQQQLLNDTKHTEQSTHADQGQRIF